MSNACAVAERNALVDQRRTRTPPTKRDATGTHDERPEEQRERRRQPASSTRGFVTSTFQRSASSGLRRGGACCSVPASSPCCGELVGERDDVLRVELLAEPSRSCTAASSSERPLAVDALEQRVHERAELHHLPVRATDERRAFLVARPVDVAEQLHPFRPVEGGRAAERRPPTSRGSCGRGHALLLVDAGVLGGGRVRSDAVEVLRDVHLLRSERLRDRARRADVRRHRGVDRSRDVRVRGHRAVDRSGEVARSRGC